MRARFLAAAVSLSLLLSASIAMGQTASPATSDVADSIRWLCRTNPRHPMWRSSAARERMAEWIVTAARDNGIDPLLLTGMVFHESTFRPGARGAVCVSAGGGMGSECHADCGAEGQACCDVTGGSTGGCGEDWLECTEDVCTSCGGDGESCCPDGGNSSRCEDGSVCIPSGGDLGSECHADCGAEGQPCCELVDSSSGGCEEGGLECDDTGTCAAPGG